MRLLSDTGYFSPTACAIKLGPEVDYTRSVYRFRLFFSDADYHKFVQSYINMCNIVVHGVHFGLIIHVTYGICFIDRKPGFVTTRGLLSKPRRLLRS